MKSASLLLGATRKAIKNASLRASSLRSGLAMKANVAGRAGNLSRLATAHASWLASRASRVFSSAFKNDSIDLSLDLIVSEVGEKKLIYTQSDKYDFLSQKHPILVDMKQRMGLDHEF